MIRPDRLRRTDKPARNIQLRTWLTRSVIPRSIIRLFRLCLILAFIARANNETMTMQSETKTVRRTSLYILNPAGQIYDALSFHRKAMRRPRCGLNNYLSKSCIRWSHRLTGHAKSVHSVSQFAKFDLSMTSRSVVMMHFQQETSFQLTIFSRARIEIGLGISLLCP